jgi:CRISPR-associated protein Cmr1
MPVIISRFYKREKLELDCEIITPMFLGNASQEAELRAAPFKGLLRYWWRVAEGAQFADHTELLAAENKLFGSTDEKCGGKSQVTLEVTPLSQMGTKKEAFPNPGLVSHPECEKTGRKTNPLNYLAGMGLIHYKNGILHSYFDCGEKFRLGITVSNDAESSVHKTIQLISAFGAIGSRSRNGWGCFAWNEEMNVAGLSSKQIMDSCDRDYPHCLGHNNKGLLLWRTKEPQPNWMDCMKDLADIYISIRAGSPQRGISKLEVNVGNPPERHLLGYPVTNHSIKIGGWGNQGRHGSALRLIVRKEADGHRGYILHLPHLFSKKMWPNGKQQQIEIWRKVHAGLDELCRRVAIEEVRS